MSIENTCAFTGHRPKSFSFGYDESHPDCKKIKKRLKKEIKAMLRRGINVFISGAAMGVDMWAMEAVLALKKREPSIRLVAAVPFSGQADRWSTDMQKRYYDLLTKCDKVAYFSEVYHADCYHERDRRMVDAAAPLIAVYDSSAKGGTAYTVAYAKEKGRNVVVINPSEYKQRSLFQLLRKKIICRKKFFTFFQKTIDKNENIIYNSSISKGSERKDAVTSRHREMRRG